MSMARKIKEIFLMECSGKIVTKLFESFNSLEITEKIVLICKDGDCASFSVFLQMFFLWIKVDPQRSRVSLIYSKFRDD